MPTITILVQGKSDPERGKKRGRIKSDTGMLFQADPGFLSQVITGSTYNITYRDDEFNGTHFRVVEDLVPVVGGATQHQPQPAPVRSEAPYSEGRRVVIAAPTPDYKDEEIGCYAILKCFKPMEGGDSEAVFHNMKMAALALRKFKAWQRSAGSDMDDDIPY